MKNVSEIKRTVNQVLFAVEVKLALKLRGAVLRHRADHIDGKGEYDRGILFRTDGCQRLEVS